MTAMTHEHSTTIPAPPARVFSALTDSSALDKWFAEHAEIDPVVGGAYRFWGRYTYGTPSRDEATQRVLAFDAPGLVSYTWRIEGIDSVVTLTLAPEAGDDGGEDKTRLAVRHEFPRAPTVARAKDFVDDLWRMAFGNLLAYLGGDGGGVMRVDFSDPTPEVRLSLMIDAPRERVFQALLDPAILDQWVSSKAQVEPRVGGRYSYGWQYRIGERDVQGGPTRIIEMVEHEKLVTDWPDWRGDPDMKPTTVTWLLESIGDRTRVTLVHAGFERAVDISDYIAGWGWFASQLKATVEKAG